MTNDVVNQMVGMLRSGLAPNAIMQRLAASDPRIEQARKMLSGKSEQELRQMVCNMCQERGMTPEGLAKMIGIHIPSNR